ncbi:alpha-amylase family glycosyl hydrolase [Ketogulonicigenium vulgare]|uniref:Alpha amylase catalytic region n=1 Tax=Ketogulonicigenium vulgare (strain WSH-001) TaxID=759362 RepID=F9Y841_KETVW|nr:alpha-amylase family glycosyl hydrolase [Ketogulonicigenium vulgare]ADO42984.1 alpha amylase catalytic region [Ketogulonicigenium vulgare Y25]AEM41167.1 Alpha amylase catalytic region [Ketogulonicigenium vulgare WSH-001]ALJ81311.1 alpha-glucosidase [Ketogulonicigenium vulgare]ANW34046.1 alpha-glucosidase [Ketogulonicigenium vulgare]AOZ54894.1 oligo-1,6-glucosidase [Ketogulonicigenium vulgare]
MTLSKNSDWWRGAVIYQIYPRSFQDTNGDGIGDLPGITQRLDHIAALGADAIWVSPFFTSPMKDFGYDVSDYCGVDPMFGTLQDFDAMVERAHALGLCVMIDLVLSHTSDQHPWFKESRRDRHNPKADWYVWANPRPDGTPPTNWLSIFGGSAWHWDSRREQYYLHNFLTSQPDLNFHNSDVQQALLDATTFWLERGVDGFRLDTINFYFHDQNLRDNPPLPPRERNDLTAPKVNPYNHQMHLFDKSRPENLAFLRAFRAVLEPYGAAAVGEVGDSERGLQIMAAYTSGGDKVQMCYPFELLQPNRISAYDLQSAFALLASEAPDAWPCWSYSNHDVIRHITRWGLNERGVRTYLMLILSLRGSVCLYQGEELGLPEAELQFEDLQDPYGIEFWPEFKGRDGSRTPMVWDGGNGLGGFTSSAKSWLPVTAPHLALAVGNQSGQSESLLEYYRAALHFRRDHKVLAHGAMSPLSAAGDVASFARVGDEVLFCAFNLGPNEAVLDLPEGPWHNVADTLGGVAPQSGRLTLEAWGFALLRRG